MSTISYKLVLKTADDEKDLHLEHEMVNYNKLNLLLVGNLIVHFLRSLL